MMYRGFYVKITPLKNITREQKDSNKILCDGFKIEIFTDSTEQITVDFFTSAVGFEIMHNTVEDAEQFAKDVIEGEEKNYIRLLEENFR